MKIFKFILTFLITNTIFSQSKNFIDVPYIETSAKIDTLVTPDKIYLNILITEKDTKGKISVEELEQKMIDKLKTSGIDVSKQVTLTDLASNFKKYFLKQQDVQKSKLYSVLIYDAKTAGKVIAALEGENISNIKLEKTEFSKIENLKLEMKSKAILKAKKNAEHMLKALNQKVGNILFISDFSENIENSLQGYVSGIRIRSAATINRYQSEVEAPEIEFEKIKVQTEVYVKFKIE
jgi:uncharacterized protein